jgi:ligand-binding SRPBCC domain-containing protein
MIHQLHRRQIIPATVEDVWKFFATPCNLNELTPPDLKFQILSQLTDTMYQGQLIEYRIKFVPGVWTRWLTEIRQVREGEYFVDEQRFGPYRLWYHEHLFRPVDSGVEMQDRVTYIVGFGPLGSALNAVWIARQLEKIFDYRAQKVAQIWEQKTPM